MTSIADFKNVQHTLLQLATISHQNKKKIKKWREKIKSGLLKSLKVVCELLND